MDSTNNSSLAPDPVNQSNTNNRPGTINLRHGTPLSPATDCVSSMSTPTTSVPAPPPSTPTTPTFLSPIRTRIVTYTIPNSDSLVSFSLVTHISTRPISMAQLNESDEESE